jgi:hypothetical protein
MGAKKETFGARAGPTGPLVGTTRHGEVRDQGRRGSARLSRESEGPAADAGSPAGVTGPW